MSHRYVLIVGSICAFLTPFISEITGFKLLDIILVVAALSLILQEVFVIQYSRQLDNIAFTRKFYRRFPIGTNHIIRYSSSLFSILILAALLFLSGFDFSQSKVIFYLTIPVIGKLLFEPLLGSFSNYDLKNLQAMFGYVVIYVFAITSSIKPAEISFLPKNLTMSYTLAATILTMLALRMAYYEKFCFENDSKLESQLSLVLLSLFALSVPELIHAFENITTQLR